MGTTGSERPLLVERTDGSVMSIWARRKIVKRCPSGHAMDVGLRTCPKCTGHREQVVTVRDDLERTIDGSRLTADAEPSLFGRVPGESDAEPSLFGGVPGESDAEPVRIRARLQRDAGGPRDDDIEIERRPVKLGRSPSADGRSRLVTLDDPCMSRDHVVLETGPEGLVVQDLHSKNGTYVNEQPVQRAVLHSGDRLRVGQTDLWVTLS
jgi:hypothetical protein